MDEQHQDKAENRPSSRERERRGAPRWTVAFLRALERTGEVAAAAVDAGIDKSTAYARRKTHADFAAAWDEALRLRSGRAEEEVQERVGFWERVKGKVHPTGSPASSPLASTPPLRPSPEGEGRKEELSATTALGGQMKRAGPGRWNAAAEQRFFDELAATANVRRAAAAAGVSYNAVYARRMKRPDFRAKWEAVLETGRAAIEMHLVESAKKSFDPDELDVEKAEPKVSVAEAIRIVQLHGGKAQKDARQRTLEEEAASMGADEVDALRERILGKLQRLREREMRRMLELGWAHDEEHDQMVPPGWVKPGESG